ncbi:MAG: hypothetical protein H7A23_10135 [Leptospiraceae bacterium]|nr:hypothetical protein [Leptospiraceae bacterium]
MTLKKCGFCNGAGVVRCTNCNDQGDDLRTGKPCKNCRGTMQVQCPRCLGKGEV